MLALPAGCSTTLAEQPGATRSQIIVVQPFQVRDEGGRFRTISFRLETLATAGDAVAGSAPFEGSVSERHVSRTRTPEPDLPAQS